MTSALQPVYTVIVELSGAELRALRNVIGYPFCGDDDDLAGIVGGHHNQLKTAKRMLGKVESAIADARVTRR